MIVERGEEKKLDGPCESIRESGEKPDRGRLTLFGGMLRWLDAALDGAVVPSGSSLTTWLVALVQRFQSLDPSGCG